MEFRITPFEDALESGEFDRLCMECHGETISVYQVPGSSAFMGELFQDNRRVYFFTFFKNDGGMACITSIGHFNKAETPLPYFKRTLTFLHELGAKCIFVEIVSTHEDQLSALANCGFELVSSYRPDDYMTILQLAHVPGGIWKNIKGRVPLRDPVDCLEKPGPGLMSIH